MPLLDHLDELRGVLLQSSIAVVVLAIGSWFISRAALDILIHPAGKLVFLGPTEAFTLRVKVSLFIGFLAALPFLLYKVWSFVAPGLFSKEKRVLGILTSGSTVLFFVGASFGFFILVPIAFAFLLGFGTENLTPMISAGNYFGFVTKLVMAFGIVFQLPLVIALLTWADIVSPDWLLKNWRFAIVSIALCSALLTPPDIASQILMGLPVILLYFISAGLSMIIYRRKRKSDEDEPEDEEEEGETG